MMDELITAMNNSAAVSNEPFNTACQHPRYNQYKIKTEKWSQDERRKKLLDIQKQNRFDFLSHVRNLADNKWNENFQDEEETDMDLEIKVTKPGRYYKDQLMLSEWMVEIPPNIVTEWVLVPCPIGKRNFVVAGHGKTKAYAKNGYCIETFSSHLPGGGRHLPKSGKEWTLLDCVFDVAAQTFYILDVMGWVNQVFYDSETEFRFYWLESKLNEMKELLASSSENKYKFVNLPKYSCDHHGINEALTSPLPFQIDGLLFYHKRTHYTFGSTPLVVWVKPYMVPDILGLAVPDKYLLNQPITYTSYETHLEQVAKDKTMLVSKKVRTSKKQKGHNMDLECVNHDNKIHEREDIVQSMQHEDLIQ